MYKNFEKATVIPLDDVVFKWGVMIDDIFFMCYDLMDVGKVLIQYPENKEDGIICV